MRKPLPLRGEQKDQKNENVHALETKRSARKESTRGELHRRKRKKIRGGKEALLVLKRERGGEKKTGQTGKGGKTRCEKKKPAHLVKGKERRIFKKDFESVGQIL